MGELDLRIADSKIEKIDDQLVNRSCDTLIRAWKQMQDELMAALDRLEEKITAHLDPTTAREKSVDLKIGGDSTARTSVTKEDALVAQKVESWPPTDLASPRSAIHDRAKEWTVAKEQESERVTELEADSGLQINGVQLGEDEAKSDEESTDEVRIPHCVIEEMTGERQVEEAAGGQAKKLFPVDGGSLKQRERAMELTGESLIKLGGKASIQFEGCTGQIEGFHVRRLLKEGLEGLMLAAAGEGQPMYWILGLASGETFEPVFLLVKGGGGVGSNSDPDPDFLGPPPWPSFPEGPEEIRNLNDHGNGLKLEILGPFSQLNQPLNLFNEIEARIGPTFQSLKHGPVDTFAGPTTGHHLLLDAGCVCPYQEEHSQFRGFTPSFLPLARPPPLPPDLSLKNVAPLISPPARPQPEPPDFYWWILRKGPEWALEVRKVVVADDSLRAPPPAEPPWKLYGFATPRLTTLRKQDNTCNHLNGNCNLQFQASSSLGFVAMISLTLAGWGVVRLSPLQPLQQQSSMPPQHLSNCVLVILGDDGTRRKRTGRRGVAADDPGDNQIILGTARQLIRARELPSLRAELGPVYLNSLHPVQLLG